MDCDVAAMSLRPGRVGANPVIIWDRSAPLSEEEANRAAEEHARLLHLDVLKNALSRPGDIYTLDEVIPREELRKSEYYRCLMKPYAVEYELGMYVSEPSGWECSVGLLNGPDKNNFGNKDKVFFLGFRPHLERSLELYAQIKRNQSEKEILEETLERLGIGTFILDGLGRVIDANAVAQHIARRNSCIFLIDKAIVLSNSKDNARFRRSINAALAQRENGHVKTFADVLRIECSEGQSLDLLIRSVSSSDGYRSDVSPSVIVYVGDSAQQQLPQERFIAQLFGLTPSEAFVAALLAVGFTLTEAAEKLDVTENTIRGYAKSIFAKTGVSRQADLVRLILKSVASLA